mgnify:CR=1 FL=1
MVLRRFIFSIRMVSVALVLVCCTQKASKKKSLETVTTPGVDSVQAHELIRLWEEALSQNTELSKTYAEDLLNLARKQKDSVFIAKGLQNLGISEFYLGNLDISQQHYKEAAGIYKKLGDQKQEGSMYYNSAINFKQQTQYDSAFAYNSKASALFKKLNDTLRMGASYDFAAGIHLELSNTRESLEYAQQAARMFLQVGDTLRYMDALTKIADNQTFMRKYSLALQTYREVAQSYRRANDFYYLAPVLLKIGSTLANLKQLDSAVYYTREALQINEDGNYSYNTLSALDALGDLYNKQEDYQKAAENSRKLMELAEAQNAVFYKVNALMILGEAQLKLKNYQASIDALTEGLNLAKSNRISANQQRAYLYLAQAYEELGAYNTALANYKLYKQSDDSLFGVESQRNFDQLRTEYETEKKEQQIGIQQKEIALLEEKTARQQLQQALLIGGVVLLLLLFGAITYGYIQKNRAKTIESQAIAQKLAFKDKELVTHVLHLAKKNEALENILQQAQQVQETQDSQRQTKNLIRTISNELQSDSYWEDFTRYYENVHKDFNLAIQSNFPDLTANDLRLIALLKMNISSKQISQILHISPEGVKKARYRLRKKLNLSTTDSLESFLHQFQ